MAQIAAETETDQAPLPQLGGLGKPAAKTIAGEGLGASAKA